MTGGTVSTRTSFAALTRVSFPARRTVPAVSVLTLSFPGLADVICSMLLRTSFPLVLPGRFVPARFFFTTGRRICHPIP